MKPSDLELIARKLPISDATRKRNQVGAVGPSSTDPQSVKRGPLEHIHQGKETSGNSNAGSSENGPCQIRITVYAVRPADWDGWHVKEIVDGCVKAGFLDNDDWRVNPTGTVTSKKVHTKEEERTEVIVIPLCTNGDT